LYADRKILPEKGRYGSCDDVLGEKICATEHDAVVAVFWTGWEEEIDDF
jgi:hypothetical protein